MDSTIIVILAVLAGLGLGAIGGHFGLRGLTSKSRAEAESEATQVLDEAREAERRILLDAKEEAFKVRSEHEGEVRERRTEIQRTEQRLANREENVDRRASNLEKREKGLTDKEQAAEELREELGLINEKEVLRLEELAGKEVLRLEELAQLSMSEARDELIHRAEEETRHELAVIYRNEEERAREEADEKARDIISLAIQRLASDVVSEATITNVPLPTDEMKGRIIGREGRNIRAIEKATGVDLIIDDTPEAVTISCFDPIRREVARLAITKLVADGRIHPARIEEIVIKTQQDLDQTIRKMGEQTILDVGVRGINPELVKLLGRLKYRFSYGENVLQHSIEVARLAGMMAGEIGANVKVATAGGLLHDIGKALTHEVDGPHAEIGADVATKNNAPEHVCTTIREHHDDDHSSPESFLVAAADAISAARPGSRRDTVEHYIQRLEALEEVGMAFDGVEKVFAIQAGREIRIMVKPQTIDDVAANKLARDVSKKIEETLAYPGQIKVTVIRESRAVEYAR